MRDRRAGQVEPRPRRGRPIQEELHRLGRQPVRRRGARAWEPQTRDGPGDLARRPERFAARGEDPQARSRLEQFRGQRRDRSQNVLTVVEDQQHPLVAEARQDARDQRLTATLADLEAIRDQSGHGAARRQRGERDQMDLREPRRGHGTGELEGQAALPGPARAGEGQQPRRPEEGEGLAELALSADEAGDGHGEARRRTGEGRIATLDRQAKLEERGVRRRGELTFDRVSNTSERGERDARAPPPVLGQHQPRRDPFVRGIARKQAFEVGDDGLVLAEREARVGALDLGGAAERVEPGGLGAGHPAGRTPVERGATPCLEGAAETGGGLRGLPLERRMRLAHRQLEPTRIDLAGARDQPVGRPLGLDAARQETTQCRDLHLEGVLGGGRRLVSPDLVDQPIARDEPAGLDEEGGQQRARSRTTEPQRNAIVDHLEWPENPEVDRQRRSSSCLGPAQRSRVRPD